MDTRLSRAQSRSARTPSKKAGPRWGGEVFSEDEREQKRHAILYAAARLFRERGLQRTRLTDIADALNVTKPSLYYYVGNKEKILILIQRLGLEQMLEGFDELAASDKTGAELLRVLLERYGEWATTEFGVCVVGLFNVKMSPRSARSLHAARRLLERKIRALFVRGIADGSIKPCNPKLAASALFGSLNWMAFWYDASRARLSAAEIARTFIDYFLDGLATQEQAASRAPRPIAPVKRAG